MTASLAGARVLIVEDEYVVADALRFLIEGCGARVTAIASSAERALASLADHPVDVAVLDVNLHGQTVIPVAEHLRAHGVPFVFLTGYGDSEVLPAHFHAHPRLNKPVDTERLVESLLELLGGAAL